VDNFNERFLDLPMFNASKLFSPKYYPIEEETMVGKVDIKIQAFGSSKGCK
jgi:hypothetical protein